MENNMNTYEVSNLVFSPGDDLESILNINEDISLSDAFLDLSKQYQAAAEYYLTLSQKFVDLTTTAVDVFCEDNAIVIEGDHPVLEELADAGLLLDCCEEEEDSELEDGVMYDDNCDVQYPFYADDDLEGPDSWAISEEEGLEV